jgi:hypothetical protein
VPRLTSSRSSFAVGSGNLGGVALPSMDGWSPIASVPSPSPRAGVAQLAERQPSKLMPGHAGWVKLELNLPWVLEQAPEPFPDGQNETIRRAASGRELDLDAVVAGLD